MTCADGEIGAGDGISCLNIDECNDAQWWPITWCYDTKWHKMTQNDTKWHDTKKNTNKILVSDMTPKMTPKKNWCPTWHQKWHQKKFGVRHDTKSDTIKCLVLVITDWRYTKLIDTQLAIHKSTFWFLLFFCHNLNWRSRCCQKIVQGCFVWLPVISINKWTLARDCKQYMFVGHS